MSLEKVLFEINLPQTFQSANRFYYYYYYFYVQKWNKNFVTCKIKPKLGIVENHCEHLFLILNKVTFNTST